MAGTQTGTVVDKETLKMEGIQTPGAVHVFPGNVTLERIRGEDGQTSWLIGDRNGSVVVPQAQADEIARTMLETSLGTQGDTS